MEAELRVADDTTSTSNAESEPQDEQSTTGPVLLALSTVSTSRQWSPLSAVIAKVNKKLPSSNQVTVREAAKMLASVPATRLRLLGIWVTSFGAKYMPIVITNPAFSRIIATTGVSVADRACTCGAEKAQKEARGTGAMKKFFGSSDYNAGRHSSTQSKHASTCMAWEPPSSGHLHSWRRGFD